MTQSGALEVERTAIQAAMPPSTKLSAVDSVRGGLSAAGVVDVDMAVGADRDHAQSVLRCVTTKSHSDSEACEG